MKRTLLLLSVLLLVVGAFVVLWQMYSSEHRDRRRLEANQRTLLTDVEIYRTRDSLSAASVERLRLTNREFKKYATDLEKTAESLHLQVRRLQSASRTAVETRYPVETLLRDTVIFRDTPAVADTLSRLYYTNPWLTLDGRIDKHVFQGNVESRDTLIQIVHRVPRKFWFIRWGTKAIRQEVTSRNPYSRITYTEYIELKK